MTIAYKSVFYFYIYTYTMKKSVNEILELFESRRIAQNERNRKYQAANPEKMRKHSMKYCLKKNPNYKPRPPKGTPEEVDKRVKENKRNWYLKNKDRLRKIYFEKKQLIIDEQT